MVSRHMKKPYHFSASAPCAGQHHPLSSPSPIPFGIQITQKSSSPSLHQVINANSSSISQNYHILPILKPLRLSYSWKWWQDLSIAWQFLSSSLWQTSPKSYSFCWDSYLLNNIWIWPGERKLACWEKKGKWSFSEVLKWIKHSSSNIKRALEKEKVLFWWEILKMFVGQNTHRNSLLNSDSNQNLTQWINALSGSCVPDGIFIISIFRNFSFTPLRYLPVHPFSSMDRHPQMMIYLYPASQLPLDV